MHVYKLQQILNNQHKHIPPKKIHSFQLEEKKNILSCVALLDWTHP